MLSDKGIPEAYDNLLYLEELSEEDYVLYPYLNLFLSMLHDKRYVIRVRGFRLLCKQAKWDSNGIIDDSINEIVRLLTTEDKPTALRQYFSSLESLIKYKDILKPSIKKAVIAIDPVKYNDSMCEILKRDIEKILILL